MAADLFSLDGEYDEGPRRGGDELSGLGENNPGGMSRMEKLQLLRQREAERQRATTTGGTTGSVLGMNSPATRNNTFATASPSTPTSFFNNNNAGGSSGGGLGGSKAGGGGAGRSDGDILGSSSGPPPVSAGAGGSTYASVFNSDGQTSSAAAAVLGPPAGTSNSMAEYLREKDEARRAPMSQTERELMARGMSSTYDPNPPKPKKPTLDLSDIRDFVSKPAPRGVIVQCRIQRDRQGTQLWYPQYGLYLEETKNTPRTFLLAARKRKKSRSSNYLMSLDRDDLARDSESYVGKVRSNYVGTEFTIYDGGEAPGKDGPTRKELAVVMYESNVLGFKGPRKMTVLMPVINTDGEPVEWSPESDAEGMLGRYKDNDFANMLCLQNKSPIWNEESQSYVLNFNKRVTQPSVKNFQVVHNDDPDYIIMQFGRVGDHEFTMDYQYPMTTAQAFGIALSSFDKKLACE